jgi:hypothetical protein
LLQVGFEKGCRCADLARMLRLALDGDGAAVT